MPTARGSSQLSPHPQLPSAATFAKRQNSKETPHTEALTKEMNCFKVLPKQQQQQGQHRQRKTTKPKLKNHQLRQAAAASSWDSAAAAAAALAWSIFD